MTPDQERRRIPSTLGGLVYLIVVATCSAGLLVVAFGPWRRGIAVIGLGLLLGAVMRASISDAEAGMLRVRRSRWLDVLMLSAVGVALIALASVIPDQPG